ncbi:MAG TPA: pilin [bacterium]|nr:pilin [bacterium]
MKNAKVFNLIKLGLIIFTFFGFFLFFPGQTLADIKDPLIFEPQIGLPGLVDKGQQITLSNKDTSYIAQMVKGFYNYGIAIAGILAAIVLMAGGIIWLTSAGSSEKISQAKGLITGSLTGLLLVFGSWLILKTVNPYLVDFKISKIKVIQPKTFCCHPTRGNVITITDKNGNESCPDAESKKCENNTRCENVSTDEDNKFGCINIKNYYCCQYHIKDSENYRYCVPVSLHEASQGINCNTVKSKLKYKDYTWETTYNQYCSERMLPKGGKNCTINFCIGKDYGYRFHKTDSGKSDDDWFCYNEIEWLGTITDKEGEPCGMKDGSICTSKGTGGQIFPRCTEKGWSHDNNAWRRRGCGEGLYCCHPDY